MPDPFKFELVSPERLLMSEEVEEVIVPGSDGEFTVYIGHAPVMSTLRPGVLTVSRSKGTDRIFVRGGFAEVNNNVLTVLAEQAIPMADLDVSALSQHIKDAEEDVADAKNETERTTAQLRLDQLKEVQAEAGK